MRNNYKQNSLYMYLYTSLVVLIIICMLVFMFDIKNNKGLIPLVYLLIILFYIFANISESFKIKYTNSLAKKKSFPILYVINFIIKLIISIVLFILSIFVFWI